jgi:uncharacterized membrane protein
MIEDMEQEQKAEQPTITARHYKVVSQWLERLGLIVVGSLVVQKIVSGAGLSDPVVILGVVVSFALYTFAYNLLLKSSRETIWIQQFSSMSAYWPLPSCSGVRRS